MQNSLEKMSDEKRLETERVKGFISGESTAVNVNKIEGDLSRLWSASQSTADSGDIAPVVKSCAINFVYFSPSADVDAAQDLLMGLTNRHPMRAILLSLDTQSAEESLSASVSARCHLLPGQNNKQLCCEQITLDWRGLDTKDARLGERLSSMVNPLVLPDLLSWLYVPTPVLDLEKALKPLLPYCNHVLIDSRGSEDLSSFSSAIKGLHHLSQSAVVLDLAWRSIKPWRKALAFAFDEQDVNISPEALNSLKSVDIKYGASGLGQSLLFAAWLTQRLGYGYQDRTESGSEMALRFDGPSNLQITLSGAHEARGINAIELTFQDELSTASLSISFASGALKVSHQDKCEFVELPFSEERIDGKSSEASTLDLIDKVLKVVKQDQVYLDTLFAVGTICGDLP